MSEICDITSATDHGDPRPQLDAAFAPRSVALIGATERPESVGLTLARNLCDGAFGGAVHFVNPNRATVLGRKAYPSIECVPAPVDLAVIATPAAMVPGIVKQCADSGVGAAVVVSAGFAECGESGAALARRALESRGQVRVIGPNCLGLAVPSIGLNATFAKHAALPGSIAFLSQSGALCTAVLDWSLREGVGFSAFVSVGSMLDVGWGDLIDYFGDDPRTKAIAVYMESVGDARRFLSAAREVALSKPIVIIKAGRTEAAAKAAASHTGCMTGSDAVFDAACERAGVLRVRTIAELFEMVEVLDMQPRPRGPGLTIVTNAGGPAVLATDALQVAGSRATLARLSDATLRSLDHALPAHWSHANPIDVLGDAEPGRYAEAVRAVLNDPATDGLLAIVTPQAMTDPTAIAREVSAIARSTDKTVLASWMGGDDVSAGRGILRHADVPTFDYPDNAAKVYEYLWQHESNLRTLYETVTLPSEPAARATYEQVERTLVDYRRHGQTLLSEQASKELLAAYGIVCVETRIAVTADDAVGLADAIGYPVVLKLHSQMVTHKAAIGGVRLNLRGPEDVRLAFASIASAVCGHAGAEAFLGVSVQPMVEDDGYELILGSSVDPQFGPVLLFGAGGRATAQINDTVLALPPLNTSLARRVVEHSRVGRAMTGAVDMTRLQQLLVRFSQLVAEQRLIRESEINPVRITRDRMIGLDARVMLQPQEVPDDQLPKPAIRPYPSEYTWSLKTRDGRELIVRPILPHDEPLVARFQESLSDQSVRSRYGGILSRSYRTSHQRLIRSCFTDFDRQIALAAVYIDPTGHREMTAVARLIKVPAPRTAEFAIVVADAWQNCGVGTQLLQRLVEVAKAEELTTVEGYVLPENGRMLRVCNRVGFRYTHSDPSGPWYVQMAL